MLYNVYMCVMDYKESEIRERLGLGKAELKAFRDSATEGAYFYKVKSNKPEKLWSVMWTEAGVQWLESNLGVKKEEIVKKPDEFECKVLIANFPNKRLVKVEKDGVAVMAVCRDNTKLKPNVIVKVRYRGSQLYVTAITKKHLYFKV